jgi:DNA-binding NtrC family response regulator
MTSPATVLIVDDEPDVCWALQRILKASGILSVTTASGHEALRLARQEPLLLAFVDAKLPDGEGLELAWRLRAAAPGLRAVLISGYFYRDDAEIVEALAAGVIDSFVGKPFPHDTIRTIARNAHARR